MIFNMQKVKFVIMSCWFLLKNVQRLTCNALEPQYNTSVLVQLPLFIVFSVWKLRMAVLENGQKGFCIKCHLRKMCNQRFFAKNKRQTHLQNHHNFVFNMVDHHQWLNNLSLKTILYAYLCLISKVNVVTYKRVILLLY